MAEHTILIVEDNDRLRRFVSSSLQKAGYRTREAKTGGAAHSLLRAEPVDLVLLDLHLQDLNGIEILKTIRRHVEDLPVIIVSSIHNPETKLDGFRTGCDDYVTKPFYIDELLARVGRMLKRNRSRGNVLPADRIDSGPFELDIQSCVVAKNGKPIEMRKKLFDLFHYFVSNPNAVLSNETLFEQVWNDRDDLNENSLYVHIRQLRKLIEDDPSRPNYITTVRNIGYRYSAGGKDSV